MSLQPEGAPGGNPGGYDAGAAAEVLGRVLRLTGGAELLVGSLAALPGAVRTAPRKGMFRSNAEQVLVGQWRYEVGPDGRLRAGHLVGGIVLAELTLPVDEAGPQVAAAIGQHIHDQGSQLVPAVLAVLAGLAVAAGP